MLSDFFTENAHKFSTMLETIDLEKILGMKKDTSEFVYVDGEEGDFGEIKYFLEDHLIATHIIEGGDSDYWEYTTIGKNVLCQELQRAFDKFLSQI
ncbi:MAG TPA: hypothetical protein VFM18_13805 [Methanosarcina sp.]|nr:hypothetical protein [Methanosarcina sp.]